MFFNLYYIILYAILFYMYMQFFFFDLVYYMQF